MLDNPMTVWRTKNDNWTLTIGGRFCCEFVRIREASNLSFEEESVSPKPIKASSYPWILWACLEQTYGRIHSHEKGLVDVIPGAAISYSHDPAAASLTTRHSRLPRRHYVGTDIGSGKNYIQNFSIPRVIWYELHEDISWFFLFIFCFFFSISDGRLVRISLAWFVGSQRYACRWDNPSLSIYSQSIQGGLGQVEKG